MKPENNWWKTKAQIGRKSPLGKKAIIEREDFL
jgi:hypothetical protein